jgi:hypothetical protein
VMWLTGANARTASFSATPDGPKTLNEYKAFDIGFNQRDGTHTELLERETR